MLRKNTLNKQLKCNLRNWREYRKKSNLREIIISFIMAMRTNLLEERISNLREHNISLLILWVISCALLANSNSINRLS